MPKFTHECGMCEYFGGSLISTLVGFCTCDGRQDFVGVEDRCHVYEEEEE